MTVALFTTCAAEITAAPVLRATVELLEAAGERVVVPVGQSCCGQPALNSGFPREAAVLARNLVRVFEPYETVVSPSGSCVATLRHHYPGLIGSYPGLIGSHRGRAGASMARRATEVVSRTYELSQFLSIHPPGVPLALGRSSPGPGMTGPPESIGSKVTYHDSCHMARILGERRAPRQVLSRIAGLEVAEMAGSDSCCGFGGTFSVKFPEISTAMADRKLSCAAATGASAVVSCDPGCIAHLAARAAKRSLPIGVTHLAEVAAQALQGAAGGGGNG
ncbi:MAG: (Fe-S)-binding protein [Acidimicrobiales bacterium]